LIDATERVRSGDLGGWVTEGEADEMGQLSRAFNRMTRQLEQQRNDLEGRRRFIETVLDGVSAGVIGLNAAGAVTLANPSACALLGLAMDQMIGRRLGELVPAFAQSLVDAKDRQVRTEITLDSQDQRRRTLLVRVAAEVQSRAPEIRDNGMGEEQAPGYVVTFDDITELAMAQRKAAWSDVARRIAHEIKNPLTPIQLSAERLQLKLEDKLDEPSRQLLNRSVNTIVTQVAALKTLINEFRDYARLPTAKLHPLDLNELINDILPLYGHALEHGVLHVELAPQLPMIQGDATLLRQVVHNLVQNALDAVNEHPPEGASPEVLLRTEIRTKEDGQISGVRLSVRDNGPGFPDKILKRAFEPYITTKAKGTGLGLAVVKKIADEHGALVRIRNLGPDMPSGPRNASDQGYPSHAHTMRGAQVSLSFSQLSSTTTQAGSHS
jgi:PAS domain S-box-containing protein